MTHESMLIRIALLASLIAVPGATAIADPARVQAADDRNLAGERGTSRDAEGEGASSCGCEDPGSAPLKKLPPAVGARYHVSVSYDEGSREWRPVPFPRVPGGAGARIEWRALDAHGELDRSRTYRLLAVAAGKRTVQGQGRWSTEYAFEVLCVCPERRDRRSGRRTGRAPVRDRGDVT